jgi:hypothetical protein
MLTPRQDRGFTDFLLIRASIKYTVKKMPVLRALSVLRNYRRLRPSNIGTFVAQIWTNMPDSAFPPEPTKAGP